MDQFAELLTYRQLLRPAQNESFFNYSDAKDIIDAFEASLYTLHKFPTVVLMTVYSVIFILGLTGNVLIIVSVYTEQSRKANLYYLVNLALADLVVTVLCIPTSVGTIVYRLWVYGIILCKLTAFVQGVAVAVSIFSMTAMSIDRYLSLKRTNQIATRTSALCRACCVNIFTWMVAFIFMIPLIFIRNIDTLRDVPYLRPLPFCIERWPHDRDRQAYGIFLNCVVFIFPALIICVCYGNICRALCVPEQRQRISSDGSTQRLVSRQKAARFVIILVIVFMICWLPYSVVSALADISENAKIVSTLPYMLWLGHVHSAINPILYWSLNKRFRESVHTMVRVMNIRACSSGTPDTSAQPHSL